MFQRSTFGHRFFFALQPPPELARRIASAAHWFEAQGGALRPERMHVSLFVLDDLPGYADTLVAMLRDLGARLKAAPVEITLDRVVGSGSSIALRPSRRIEALAGLRQRLVSVAGLTGVAERRDYRFSPHLTLGYRHGAPFQQRIKPVTWRADEVVLIHSLLGQTRHDLVGRWPLDGSATEQLALF